MSEFRKFLIIAIPFLSLAALVSYCTRETALDFHAEGVVVTAKWNTRNHQMSLFEIKTHTGKVNCGVRFAEMYHLSPSLPFNPLSYLVRFGSKTDLNPDYQTISNMSAIRSLCCR
jgi:hypothetical protein